MSIRSLIGRRLMRVADTRAPDFTVGGQDDPYLLRWFVIPRNRFFNIYLHKFCRSDDDRALHTHPWRWNCSWLLQGSYIEHTPKVLVVRNSGTCVLRRGESPHRVELHTVNGKEHPVWTLFLTGDRVREWFFLCPQGRIHWKAFTKAKSPGEVGVGCDQ